MKRRSINKAAEQSGSGAETPDLTATEKTVSAKDKTPETKPSSAKRPARKKRSITAAADGPGRPVSRRRLSKAQRETPLVSTEPSVPPTVASSEPTSEKIEAPKPLPSVEKPASKIEGEVQPSKPSGAAPAASPVRQPSTDVKPPAAKVPPPKPPVLAALKLPVPPILLEGDEPVSPSKTGPGEKFAVGTAPSEKRPGAATEQLPASYGTGRLSVIARDPYSLFVHWDFTDDQQRYYNTLSADRHLVLRAHYGALAGAIAQEAHVHAETRHWFLHVPRAGTDYFVQIGYYLADGAWITLRSSGPVPTQPDRASEDQTVRFAYAPGMTHMCEVVALQDLGIPDRPTPPEFHETIKTPILPETRPPVSVAQPRWTTAQEEALTEMITSLVRKEQVPGSLEILELLQRQVRRQFISFEEELGLPGPPSAALGISSVQEQLPSSVIERAPRGKGFWFNVNAELIIYGATEPDARVTLGGRPIKLRPDGSFSYRFALPDGYYELPAAATASDQSETRRAELHFSRETAYSGDVGAHPQDKALRIPAAENVA